MTTRFAAQYIRMSTDKQDLSPVVQKETIAAYAAARGIEVVASYEDEGRSGVHLKNRPALLRLLRDVTASKSFASVLVYDVSRWGRFQDSDAAAYYEYHCRLHGVEVIYVAETFGDKVNPITALLKSMRRAMAAEYSRDLATKCRAGQELVISRGFQIGPLPPLGFRRCSVSADGQQRVILNDGQRKAAATDRIEWVLGPKEEIELVKRICHLYTRTRLSISDISRLGSAEGWRTHRGRGLSEFCISRLLRNEALIGNFVWGGRTKCTKGIVEVSTVSRRDGCIPRLIDDETWTQIQRRMALETRKFPTDEEVLSNLKKALQRDPLLTPGALRAQGLPHGSTLRARLGPWAQCLERVGQDQTALREGLVERSWIRGANRREFGHAIAGALRQEGHQVEFFSRLSVLEFPDLRLRVRLLWPMSGEVGQVWCIRVDRISRNVDFDLLVRMESLSRPKDFFVVPPADVVVRFPRWLIDPVATELARFWCQSPQQLIERIGTLAERGTAHGAVRSDRVAAHHVATGGLADAPSSKAAARR